MLHNFGTGPELTTHKLLLDQDLTLIMLMMWDFGEEVFTLPKMLLTVRPPTATKYQISKILLKSTLLM